MPVVATSLPQYLSLAQASALTNLSIRTLRRAVAAKKLDAHRLGRLIRIDAAELHRWVEADGAAMHPAHGKTKKGAEGGARAQAVRKRTPSIR
jgi:excisionase family DNA binding protein